MSNTYKIPYVNLEYIQEKLEERDIRWKEIQEESPHLKNVPNDDALRFQPWVPITQETHTNFVFNTERPWLSKSNPEVNNIIVEEDDATLDVTGIYMMDLGGHYDIEELTNFRRMKYSEQPILLHYYGVSDNATQVKKYIDECINAYQHNDTHDNTSKYRKGKRLIQFIDAMEEKNRDYGFVLLLTPIVNEHKDSAGTWRWHKWGKYIGHHNIEHEYLNDEDGIDFVFVWELVTVVKDDEVK